MKVITYATKKDQYYDSLEDSCKKFGYELITLGLGKKWNGMGDKIKGVHEYLSQLYYSDEFVLVVDAYDVVFCRQSSEIEKEFLENYKEDEIVFNSERLSKSYAVNYVWENSYSDIKFDSDTEYKKMNAGVVMGKIKKLIEFYQKFITSNNLESENIKSDQRLIYKMLEKNTFKNITIDSKCKLFTTFSRLRDDIEFKGDKVFNSHTETYPFLIHGPGKLTKMDNYIKKLGVKLNYTKSSLKHYSYYYVSQIADFLIFIGIILSLYLSISYYRRESKIETF